jgi:DNA-directed RNA polymerase subunit RPC12/RpoP
MNCPSCGSDRIHRSRRKGIGETVALPLFGVYPYRCSACRARFRRFNRDRGRDVARYVHDAPEWLKRLVWSAIALLLGFAACLFVLLRISRR